MKKFTGFMSSVANPGQLSRSVDSFKKALLSGLTMLAVVKGLDAVAVTTQLQQLFDLVATAVTAGMTIYHSVMTISNLVDKLFHYFFAKEVVTIPTAEPVAVTVEAPTQVVQ